MYGRIESVKFTDHFDGITVIHGSKDKVTRTVAPAISDTGTRFPWGRCNCGKNTSTEFIKA